jgi:hypothetical protein
MGKRTGVQHIVSICIFGVLISCNSTGPTLESSVSLTSLASTGATGISITTGTASITPSPIGETESPTPSATKTRMPTDTAQPFPTPWPEGFTPTVRPTPTRGLDPTATLGAMQSCPAPTQASVAIERLKNPADYEPVLLDQLSATGELNSFKEKVKANDTMITDRDTQIVIFRAEVNNDSAEESVISIRQPYEAEDVLYGPVGVSYRTAVFVFGCRDHRYAALHVLILDRKEIELPSGLLAVEDLNGNGIKEIVVSTVENIGDRGGQNLFAKVLEWNGTVFREILLPDSQNHYASNTLESVVEFRDVDGNGTQEILVPQKSWMDGAGVDCEFGPDRNSSAVWMWDGDLYQYMWREFAAPEYRFQAAYDGDYYSYLGLFRNAETMYLRAVFDSSLRPGSYGDWTRDGECPQAGDNKPDATEPRKIQAYARFRLVELLVRAGRVLEAQMHWDFLRTNFPIGAPGHIYSYLANVFWWEYVKEENVAAACAVVKQEAEKNKAEVFGLFGAYGQWNPGPTVENICPFSS